MKLPMFNYLGATKVNGYKETTGIHKCEILPLDLKMPSNKYRRIIYITVA